MAQKLEGRKVRHTAILAVAIYYQGPWPKGISNLADLPGNRLSETSVDDLFWWSFDK